MRDCLITGFRIQYGHNVSHANNKTQRIFRANVHSKRIFSDVMGNIKVTISHRGERTIDKYGGLDAFLLNAKNRKLTPDAKVLRKRLLDQNAKAAKKLENQTA